MINYFYLEKTYTILKQNGEDLKDGTG